MSSPVTPRPGARRARELVDPARLVRYGATGALSASTHLLVLALLVEVAGLAPVLATTAGFLASVAVSYGLQHRWVFRSVVPDRRALPRFLVVTVAGFGLNAAIMWVGTEVLTQHYLAVHVVALVAVPVSNYTLNGLWTFRS